MMCLTQALPGRPCCIALDLQCRSTDVVTQRSILTSSVQEGEIEETTSGVAGKQTVRRVMWSKEPDKTLITKV